MYDTSAKASTEERELHPIDNGTSQPPINEKEKEALEESAIVPPPTAPRSAITTEGKKGMHYVCDYDTRPTYSPMMRTFIAIHLQSSVA